jgi:hypothetical protein
MLHGFTNRNLLRGLIPGIRRRKSCVGSGIRCLERCSRQRTSDRLLNPTWHGSRWRPKRFLRDPRRLRRPRRLRDRSCKRDRSIWNRWGLSERWGRLRLICRICPRSLSWRSLDVVGRVRMLRQGGRGTVLREGFWMDIRRNQAGSSRRRRRLCLVEHVNATSIMIISLTVDPPAFEGDAKTGVSFSLPPVACGDICVMTAGLLGDAFCSGGRA